MTILNLEEQTLALDLCRINENNTARVARILSEKTEKKIDPGVVRRVLRKNNFEVNEPGRPKKVEDSELERCFNKYCSSQNLSVYPAAQKTAEELGYPRYTSVLYRWHKLNLI